MKAYSLTGFIYDYDHCDSHEMNSIDYKFICRVHCTVGSAGVSVSPKVLKQQQQPRQHGCYFDTYHFPHDS